MGNKMEGAVAGAAAAAAVVDGIFVCSVFLASCGSRAANTAGVVGQWAGLSAGCPRLATGTGVALTTPKDSSWCSGSWGR